MSNPKQLKLIALHEFLEKQDVALINELYEHPATCMSVFRELPSLAKHIIIRILFINQPIARQLINTWVQRDKKEELAKAIGVISGLRIWDPLENNLAFELNNVFRVNLQKALFGGGETWTTAKDALGPDKHAKSVDDLDGYAKERWDALLSYLTRESTKGIGPEIIELLKYSNLCDANGETRFQFLLLDRSSQVWYILIKYLDYVQKLGMDLVKVLSFVLQLGFCSLGIDYPCDNSDEQMSRVIQHFRELGLIFKRKGTAKRFYPTRLALSISIAGAPRLENHENCEQFIVVETNYRIYAYTDSDLHYAIISLFSEVLYRFPFMIVAQMSRDSVQQSADYGINAPQILHYLRSSAHPTCRKNQHWVPQVVSDNIHLWCDERQRLKFKTGTLYNQFLTQEDFEFLRDYAQDIDALIWQSPEKRFMVVTPESHEQIKRYYKTIKDRRHDD